MADVTHPPADSVDERLPDEMTSSSPPPSSSQPEQERQEQSPERRFGYDYGGGYDREMGGRPGYGDERPHGRYQDWEGGRGGPGDYGDASNSGSTQRDGLMSYKQFIQELKDDILPSEAELRYQEYKSEYITTQKRAYFNSHKEEEWLKNKYHPANLLSFIERRNELARKVAEDFLHDLQSGTLDLGPAVTKSGRTSDPNSEDEAADGGKETELLSVAPKAPSFTSDPKRILTDIEQAQSLVRKLNSEKGIKRGLTSSIKGLEGVGLLDTLVTYLWRVHGVDYYGKIETKEAKGLPHVRAEGKGSEAKGDESENKFDSYWQERSRLVSWSALLLKSLPKELPKPRGRWRMFQRGRRSSRASSRPWK